MTPDASPQPTLWHRIDLQPSAEDRTSELVGLLTELGIPGVVRRSRLEGDSTYAVVLADDESIPLAVVDGFQPTLRFARVDMSVLEARIAALDATVDDPGALAPRIDGIAWMSSEKDDLVAMLGSRFEMAFDVVDAATGDRVIAPSRGEELDAALERGVWAMTDGVALWRAGAESTAVFVRRRRPYMLTWETPWTTVDPSRPGQRLEDGPLLAEVLLELTTQEADLAAWTDRFGLEDERAEALRILARREPAPGILHELAAILRLPDELLLMADPLTDRSELGGHSVIEPRNARSQFSDAMRSLKQDESRTGGFRFRHPRVWVGIALIVIAVLLTYSVAGLIAGRGISALLPGAIGLVWAGSLVVDGSFRRAWGTRASEAQAVVDTPPAD